MWTGSVASTSSSTPTTPTWATTTSRSWPCGPDRQNRGLGTALLAHHHRHLDRHGIGAYLDAASPNSYRLYLRHGYAPHGEPITLSGLQRRQLWPMWRQPGACRGTLPAPGAV